MIHDIIHPLAPAGDGWIGGDDVRHLMRSAYPVTAWSHPMLQLFVLSAVEVAGSPNDIERGPEFHISVSKQYRCGVPSRCSKEEGAFVLQAFGNLDGWDEDNHMPNGQVRNYWRAVADNMAGIECACKKTEHIVIEGDFEHRPLEPKS